MKVLLLILFSSLFLKASLIDSLTKVYSLNSIELDSLFEANESEKTITTFKDDSLSMTLKLIHLKNINKSRSKRKLNSLKLNILASRLANQICDEAAKENYISHWNLKGEKPYHRWGKLKQFSHIEENTFLYESNYILSKNWKEALKLMKEGHDSFMAEKAPYDGHKQTILRKPHTSVGLGFAFNGKQFRYNEEFLDEYIINVEVVNNTISFKPINDKHVHFVVISSDKITSKSVKWLNRSGSYLDQGKTIVDRIPYFNMKKVNDNYEFSVPKLEEDKAYYIQIYMGNAEPKPNKLSSKNLFPASGIVIIK